MNPRHRTLLGILLFVPLAAIIFATFACLPAPIGDPDTANIDPALTGVYQHAPDPDGKQEAFAILSPWDAHTYYLTYIDIDRSQNPPSAEQSHYKAWLTTLGNATFICCQSVDQDFSAEKEKPEWPALRLDKTPSGLTARLVDADSVFLKNAQTNVDQKTLSATLQTAISDHANDDALYTKDKLDFKKLDPAAIKTALPNVKLEIEPPAAAQSPPASPPAGMP